MNKRTYEIEIISKDDFERSPKDFMRKSSPDKQIVVLNETGNVQFAFGGNMSER